MTNTESFFNPKVLKNDTLSGLTVALALVPEAVAFALIAHVNPIVGLYAAFFMGLIAAAIGGRPGMITGATGAIAVVAVALVVEHDINHLFVAVVLMGLIQILFGIFKLGKFIRLVPHPVFLGFVNGLALVIFIAQLAHFQLPNDSGAHGVKGLFVAEWIPMTQIAIMLAIAFLTMAIIQWLPKFTTIIPSTLAAIIVGTVLVLGLMQIFPDFTTKTVGDITSIKGGLPQFSMPTVTMDIFLTALPYAIIMALVGLIESLLTLNLIDEITETTGRPNKECIGQGVANTVTGLFGGMGGCAMVGQSIINIKSGGRGRWSGISAALFLLMFILYASSLIEVIPIAVLMGVMFMVVIGTFEWSSFGLLTKIPPVESMIGIAVAVITVFFDLAVAVIIGVILSALVFAWEHAKHINVRRFVNDDGQTIYQLEGALFFGSIRQFQELFSPKEDTDDVIIDFQTARVADHSALEAIDKLADRYQKAGRTLHLVHLSEQCRLLLDKAGPLVEVNVKEDPHYSVAVDNAALLLAEKR
jgi:SulP family sulfate permease